MLKGDRGFTLIEIVLTIVILGIVAAAAQIILGSIFSDTKDATLRSAFGSANTQLTLAVNKLKGLPTAPNGNPPGGTFRREVYNNLTFSSSGLSKASISCNGTDCTFVLRTNNCQAGKDRRITVTYNGPTNLTSPGRLYISAGPVTC
jgi:prepilin-type N-terminal cleavage/methylation domain-containing protein